MIYRNRPKFKVVEINNVTALRSGQMFAQSPLAEGVDNELVNDKYGVLENGFILTLNTDGELVAADGNAPHIALHFTEELLTGAFTSLSDFAVEPNNEGEFYPRALILNPGDVFTTNNVAGIDTRSAKNKAIYGVKDGVLTEGAAGHQFLGVSSTLPNGDDAVTFTYLGVAGGAAAATVKVGGAK